MASRVSPHRLVGGVGILLLERGAVVQGPGAGVGVALVAADVEPIAEPVVAEHAGVAEVAPERLQLAAAEAELGSGHLAALGGHDVDDAAERVGAVERRAGPPHHLHLAQVLQRLGHAVPLLGAEERDGEVAAILQHQHPAVERRVEAAGVDVEVVDPALHHVHARHGLQRHRRLAGDRGVLQHLRRHHRDRRRRLDDALGRAGCAGTTISVSATGTGSIAASTVAVRSASTVVRISIGL